MFKKSLYLSSLLGILISGGVSAAGLEIGVGIAGYENPWDVDDSKGPKITVGYRTEGALGYELSWADIDAIVEADEIGFRHTNLNMLYHFGDGNFQSYLLGGAGSYAGNGALNAGFGLKMRFGHFQLRPEVGIVKSLSKSNDKDAEAVDATASLTLAYLFGGQKKSAPVAAAEPEITPPSDTDGDGIVDTQDRCPATPIGATIDAAGCPKDSDGDSVPDFFDRCSNTKAGLKVDDQGCAVKLMEDVSISLNVNFDSNSSVVNAEYFREISKAANFLEQYENTTVIIEGHSDTRGSAAYNKSLSQKRADSVAMVLINIFKISPDRVSSRGYGEERPIADESTQEGLMKNRRVVANIKAVVETYETK